MLRRLFIILLLVAMAAPVLASAPMKVISPFARETSDYIRELLTWREVVPPVSLGVIQVLSHEEIARLYEERDHQPLWFEGRQLRPAVYRLLEHLRNAGQHGLCPENYLIERIDSLMSIHEDFALHRLPLAPDNRALLDLFLSQAFLTYATHLMEGQVDPSLAHVDWRARRRKADVVKLLQYAVEQNRVDQVLDDLLPPHEGYRQLATALQHYSDITALGGWPVIPPGPTLRPGDRDTRLALLRERLLIDGDLAGEFPDTAIYDMSTVAAVKHFQVRHGLAPDGAIGPKTLAALNVTASERVRQIELNLERWRWQGKNFGRRYIQVNIADFSLAVMEEGLPVLTMPVIVGTLYRKTPVFSARMTYLEFAPYWTVPPTILREDKLPKIKRDPAYLASHHYRVLKPDNGELIELDPEQIDWNDIDYETFPGILRMDPGPWNPLGQVKFMFPNGFNVYLHDTNERYLFYRDVRSLSSGCIRIRRPLELAQYLLEDENGEVDCDKLFALLNADSPQKVGIKAIPVHLQYWTAWVAIDGSMQFRDDVYLRDLDLDIALGEPAYRTAEQLRVTAGPWRVAKTE